MKGVILSRSLVTKITATMLFLIVAAGLFVLGAFLYINFYEPLTEGPAIVLLRAEVATVSIDTASMKKVLAFLDAAASPSLERAQNPFTMNQTAPTGAPTPAPTPTPQLK